MMGSQGRGEMEIGSGEGIPSFDFHIDVANAEEESLKFTRLIRPQWEEKDIRLKRFTGGITNTLLGSWHKDDGDHEDVVLIRIYGANTELIIDREMEMCNIQLLHAIGCSRPLYARFSNGIAYGFFPGRCLDSTSVRDEDISRLVAQQIVRISSIDPDEILKNNKIRGSVCRKPMVFDRCRKWLDLIPEEFSDAEKNKRFKNEVRSKLQLTHELEKLQQELEPLRSPVVFCHNDLLLSNIVYNADKKELAFIDFEYGAFNYEAFEIGNHFDEYAGVENVDYSLYPDRDYQMKWLRMYLELKAVHRGSDSSTVTDRDVEVLYVQVNKFALAAHFYCGIWALIQACHSTIDFDYLGYGIERFNEYFSRRDEFLALKMPA